ncbi:hypothetical protein P1P68_06030 [Streptomyces scabiei]|uniref:hypothetical protein n=1 Tax=Streptomyces scabiei TaxID=1930 RepID=UPI00298F498D|nr:hypothetical protein [Streptomyces scabiei]MDW8804361.1 hypothetical protein [Streptomyces scabiei]
MMNDRAAKTALVYALLRASANLADTWGQTPHQAVNKGWHNGDTDSSGRERTSREGRRACAAHCLSYVALQGLAVLGGSAVTGTRLRYGRVAAGLALSGMTHYYADRRRPLKALAKRVGKGEFWDLGGELGGNFQLDQAWHHSWELVAALLIAGGKERDSHV